VPMNTGDGRRMRLLLSLAAPLWQQAASAVSVPEPSLQAPSIGATTLPAQLVRRSVCGRCRSLWNRRRRAMN